MRTLRNLSFVVLVLAWVFIGRSAPAAGGNPCIWNPGCESGASCCNVSLQPLHTCDLYCTSCCDYTSGADGGECTAEVAGEEVTGTQCDCEGPAHGK
jgi:hypothetical protein